MKWKAVFVIFAAFLFLSAVSYAERAVKVKPKKDTGSTAVQHDTKYYAIIIGNQNYKHLPKLKTPIADAKAVENILKTQYGFETKLLTDAPRKDILSTINDFRKKLSSKDNLLIYYAGHGEFDKTADRAYWLPVDAQRDDPVDWISATDITDNIKRIASKHILIVSDSCYSGTLTRAVAGDLSTKGDRDQFIKKMMERPSRTLMASGGNEPVADSGGGNNSVFAAAFLKALKEADKPLFTAEEIFHGRVKTIVAGKSDQVPEYNDIKNSGHEGGDFVFQTASALPISTTSIKKDELPSLEISEELSKLREEKARLEREREELAQKKALIEEKNQLEKERQKLEKEKTEIAMAKIPSLNVKMVRAIGGITLSDVGKQIAVKDSVTRADLAALLIVEMKLDKLFAGRIQIDKMAAKFVPDDIRNHHFKDEVITMLKWGVRGFEPVYDPTAKAYLFKPNDGITRKKFALMLEDVLIKLTGDEKLAIAYLGEEKSPFPDVLATSPYYNAVMNMTTRGLMEPELSGKFRINDPVDGAEAILAIRVLKQRMRVE